MTIWLLMMTTLMASAQAQAQAPPRARESMTLEQIDAAWAECYATHNVEKAREIFAPDIVVTATTGQLKDRETELMDVAPAPGMHVNYFRSSDVRAREFGDAGVVTGRIEWEVTAGPRTSVTKRRYTATYVRGGAYGWRMVALHIGAAPDAPSS